MKGRYIGWGLLSKFFDSAAEKPKVLQSFFWYFLSASLGLFWEINSWSQAVILMDFPVNYLEMERDGKTTAYSD